MRIATRISFGSLLLLILIGCSEKKVDSAYQFELVNHYLKGELNYEYYSDSTIKEACKINQDGIKHGRVVQFTREGILKRVFFINIEGDTVGDDSRFTSGHLSEHYFRLGSDKTLFFAKFSENGELIFSDGHPFFLSGTSEVKKMDTIDFYIAAPILPGYHTNITFGQLGDKESQVTL